MNLRDLINDTIPNLNPELEEKLAIRLENYLSLALDLTARKGLDYGLTLGGINSNFVINGLPIQTVSEQQDEAETESTPPADTRTGQYL